MSKPEVKYRHELKYIVSSAQIPLLKSRIAAIMHLDPHADSAGRYIIRSLYFDDYDNRCYYEKEDGTDPREKFRIRTYNNSPAVIHLECKRKERGKTLKTAAEITMEQANQAMEGVSWSNIETLPPLLRKMKLQMDTRLLKPVVIVEYERFPYVYQNGNVRVTFDMNVSSSTDLLRFWDESLPKRPLMPPGMHLMEVKFDEYLPDFFYRGLNLGMLHQTAYSKYYLCRKYTLK